MIKILMIIVIFVNIIQAQDTIIVNKSTPLFSGGSIDVPPTFDSLINRNFEFDGFLVIKFDKVNLIQTDTLKYNCKVYWINSLVNLNDEKYFFQHFELFSMSFKTNSYNLKKNSNGQEIKDFINFYRYFNHNSEEDCRTYLYDGLLTTDLFKNSIIWLFEGNYYIIFSCRFYTAIIKTKMAIKENKKYKYKEWRIFVPTSKIKSFGPLTEDKALKFGMQKSDLLIKLK